MGRSRDETRARLASLEQFGIKLGLDNALALSRAMGHPERGYPSVLIAGTNGKGSVSAMVSRALSAAGLRTGLYTSPHLVALNERVQIDGRALGDDDLDEAVDAVLDTMDDLMARGVLDSPVTYFEATTAAAFHAFGRAGVDVAVVEVGLGGRFDATNIVPQRVAAITSIGLDHTKQLGTTLERIAFEKAGIIKPDAVTVVGPMGEQARAEIERVARELGAPLRSHDTVQVSSRQDGDCWVVTLETRRARYGPLRLSLRGRHQVSNAGVATAVLEELAALLPLDTPAIESGLSSAVWPGRLQVLTGPEGRELLVDGAHNEDGTRALASFLRDTGRAPSPILLAVMRDKDAGAMVRSLAPVASRFVCTQLDITRSQDAQTLADLVRTETAVSVVAEADLRRSVRAVFGDDRRACAAGSLYFVGELLARESSKSLW